MMTEAAAKPWPGLLLLPPYVAYPLNQWEAECHQSYNESFIRKRTKEYTISVDGYCGSWLHDTTNRRPLPLV